METGGYKKMAKKGKLVPAKHKFRGMGIPMAIGTGFPDFIAFRRGDHKKNIMWSESKISYEVIGVECKVLGYLDKAEKEKCQWLLDNNIFSKILIAKKTKVKNRVVIEYKEFKSKDLKATDD